MSAHESGRYNVSPELGACRRRVPATESHLPLMEGPLDILLIRLKSIGDVLFTLPSVHTIRSAFPQARISFLVSKELAPLLRGFRDVDVVIPLDRGRFRGLNPKALIAETCSLLRQLRQNRFSLAVDFQGYGETALLTWWSRACQRWGVVYRRTRRWAYTKSVTRANHLHPAEAHLAFLRECELRACPARNEFEMPSDTLAEARDLFSEHRLDPKRPTLFIEPFTSSPMKNWPLDRYVAVARHWRSRGVQVLFGGAPSERAALAPVQQAGFPVSSEAPLLVTGSLMKLSTVVLGGDTGLLHLAVAAGKRVVMIMGSLRPGRCYPFGHPDWAVVPPEGRPISSLAEGTINEAITAALA
jgi:ADP-heptose:LPS heptosyltransferase